MDEERVTYNRPTSGDCPEYRRLSIRVGFIIYHNEENIQVNNEKNTCYICLEDVDPTCKLVVKNCQCLAREYCLECLIKWMQTSTTCPICKVTIKVVWYQTDFDMKTEFKRLITNQFKQNSEKDLQDVEEIFHRQCDNIIFGIPPKILF